MNGDRSPLSPFALTLAELHELGPGTHIVFYHMGLGPSPVLEMIALDERFVYTRPVGEPTAAATSRARVHVGDVGLTPMDGGEGRWNPSNITITANRLDDMPEITDPQPW